MATQVIKEKRRGRPPKNLVTPKPVKEITSKIPSEEQLVLYLPNFNDDKDNITDTDISLSESDDDVKIKNNKNIDNKNTEIQNNTIPSMKINTKSTTNTKSNSKMTYLTDKTHVSYDEFTEKIDNIENDSEAEDSVQISEPSKINKLLKNDYKNINTEKLINELNRREALIMTLKSKLKDKSLYNENTIALTKDNKKKLLNLGLISINKNKLQIAEKTNIACWWCTYEFDTCPCFLPDHYKNNRYYVFGNFCGFSCMLAYNENLDDYRKSVRTVLIKQMYRDIFVNNDNLIKPAGPRELLQKFGGPLDISQYRDPNTICVKTFKMTIPPLIPLISEYEEVMIDK